MLHADFIDQYRMITSECCNGGGGGNTPAPDVTRQGRDDARGDVPVARRRRGRDGTHRGSPGPTGATGGARITFVTFL